MIISHQYTPLFLAATAGNATLLNTLFNYGANLDSQGNQRHSPLNQAVQKKRSDCLEILLTRSAKPTNDGLLSPLMQAICLLHKQLSLPGMGKHLAQHR